MSRAFFQFRRRHVDTSLDEFVSRYNRRFYPQSFEKLLGLAARQATERQRSACVEMARAVRKPRAKITMRRPGRH